MRITYITYTHNALVTWDPVLCASVARLRKDELTGVSEGRNESDKKYEDCDVTPPRTFSLHLPVTNLFPEKENVKLRRRKEREMFL